MQNVWKKKRRKFSRIFEYDDRNEQGWNLEAPHIDLNKTDAERFRKRMNVSLLSSLIDTGYLSDIRFFKEGMISKVTNIGIYAENPIQRFFETSEKLFKNQTITKEVLSFIKEIDLGISDFNFKEITLPTGKKNVLECLHGFGKKSFSLELLKESNGTQSSISMLFDMLVALKKGTLVIIDEIEAHLHPDVVKKMVSLFESKNINPHSTQLLFSTHEHLLLNDRTKTQIFITEKNDKSLETEVYRLDNVEGVRNDENYFHKYIAGTYGGTPHIKWL